MHRIISLDDFDKDFLLKSNEWLNDPEIQFLVDGVPVSLDEQCLWFNSLKSRNDYKIWGVSCEGERIGTAGLRHLSNDSGEFFCYVGEKKFWGGVGRPILKEVEAKAIMLGLKKIWLRVKPENERARILYDKMGYLDYYKNDTFYFMKKQLL